MCVRGGGVALRQSLATDALLCYGRRCFAPPTMHVPPRPHLTSALQNRYLVVDDILEEALVQRIRADLTEVFPAPAADGGPPAGYVSDFGTSVRRPLSSHTRAARVTRAHGQPETR